jgi:arylsulfatase A-like enzyme
VNNRPNIIFFFSDQQRWDTVGCYGQKLDITPNLDKMAAEGVKFEYAFTCQPVCGPARACLQTGKYATEMGCFKNGIALPLEERTIAKMFNEVGYETAYVGKWHLASTNGECNFATEAVPPERRGGYKDYWMAADVLEFTSHGYDGYVYDKDMNRVDFIGYRPDCITDFALDYLRNRSSEKPFFMFLSHIEPHHQNDRNTYEGPEGSKEKYKNYEVPSDLEGTKGDWRENYPDYLGCCNSLDYNLGRIRAELQKLGIADNTIIIYTSDHGSHFRTRNGEYKRACHENCIRIPMIVYGPGFKGGKVVDELVSLIDLPPTLLSSAGIEVPETMKGKPLQNLLGGDSAQGPQEVFLQISENHVGRAIRTKRWKYSVRAIDKNGWKDSSSDTYVEDYLYDLENDYDERNNLVADLAYLNIRRKLSEVLKVRMEQAGEKVPEIVSK